MARDGDLVLSAPDAEAEFAPLVVFDIEPPQPIPDMEAAPTVIETMAGTVVVRLDGTTPAGYVDAEQMDHSASRH